MIGVPHGALDNVIFLREKNWGHIKFYSVYIGMMLAYVATWFFLPKISLALFIVLSAYHFGQSQFSTYADIPRVLKVLIYFTWGISILSGLIYYRNADILSFMMSDGFTNEIAFFFDHQFFEYLNYFSTGLCLLLLFIFSFRSLFSWDDFMREVLILSLIHISFYVLPVIVGFTLYFVILHSGKVLIDEYDFFKSKIKELSLWKFIKLLLPITLISVLFLVGFIFLSHQGWLPISNVFLALILVSIFTLPHSIVMEVFYERML